MMSSPLLKKTNLPPTTKKNNRCGETLGGGHSLLYSSIITHTSPVQITEQLQHNHYHYALCQSNPFSRLGSLLPPLTAHEHQPTEGEAKDGSH